MSEQLGFCIEQHLCTGCKACQVACKDKNNLELGQLWRKVTESEGGNYTREGNGLKQNVYAYWTSMSCNHCVNPSCVEACPTGAMYKREQDGIVLIDQEKCIGCGVCKQNCPYDAPQLIEEGKMGKCNYCIDLIQQGKEPQCVAACPLRALHSGPIEELKNKYKGTNKTQDFAETSTEPSIVIVPHKNAVR
ncbi:DMSO/selenate family reductase complex B subunit [Alkaliphilus sp. B6464]|uniref:DMSO/selenate family reductase complex B subunit n=1 Tax=Alkaliphilus sp. B6464 TaxID=2731219 RepID=UPI001BA93D54|nr:DMSO/selenate family reductase complex B subunit [Alkaliphilus sp. B6464]QUH19922.1 dimethylsulfoxide reductase subunit B [Alkaliphilus sp. B6464]